MNNWFRINLPLDNPLIRLALRAALLNPRVPELLEAMLFYKINSHRFSCLYLLSCHWWWWSIIIWACDRTEKFEGSWLNGLHLGGHGDVREKSLAGFVRSCDWLYEEKVWKEKVWKVERRVWRALHSLSNCAIHWECDYIILICLIPVILLSPLFPWKYI